MGAFHGHTMVQHLPLPFLTAWGVPKETSHIAKYNSNAAKAYWDRISALTEDRPGWTCPSLRRRLDLGTCTRQEAALDRLPIWLVLSHRAHTRCKVCRTVLELLLTTMWQIMVASQVGAGAAGWVEEEGDEATAMESDTHGSYCSTWWMHAWCSMKCFTDSKCVLLFTSLFSFAHSSLIIVYFHGTRSSP
jgi:hypothetical protein